ncbi:MAG: hypothetical protein E7104_02475 [Prevotella sp.]|nr:hypothetical protein [Prevotella sp.]
MTNDKEARSALNIYFPRLFGCTGFADSIHSVSDLRFLLSSFAFMFTPATLTANAQSVTFGSILPFFNISILLGANQHAESNATRTHLEGI